MDSTLTLPIALFAGFLSFASPCFLPVVPVFASYVAGTNPRESARARRVALLHSLAFVSAFSVVFVALWLIVGTAGSFIIHYRDVLRIAAGLLIVVLGVHLAGIVRIPGLDRTMRPTVEVNPEEGPSLRRSVLLGLAFGAGWTPCIGPVLGSIIALASTTGSIGRGTLLLVAYCIGLGVPFVLIALGTQWVTTRMQWLRTHQRALSLTAGVLLIVTGLLIIADLFAYLAAAIPQPL
ncbi:MAG: cytochrome c biogenesis protein CcdA [Actinomycetaceae bacterium]|nr:cytochrome c biogenesis protein CcdA [Actinomycetaceae bacterium]